MKNPGILIAAFPKWSVQVARIAAITLQKAKWIMRMYVLEDFKLYMFKKCNFYAIYDGANSPMYIYIRITYCYNTQLALKNTYV